MPTSASGPAQELKDLVQAARVADRAALPERLPLPGRRVVRRDADAHHGHRRPARRHATRAVSSSPCRTPIRSRRRSPTRSARTSTCSSGSSISPCSVTAIVYGAGGPVVLTVNSAGGDLLDAGSRHERVVRPRRRRLRSPRAPSVRPASASSTCRRAPDGAVVTLKVEKQQVAALGEYLAALLADLPPTRRRVPTEPRARRAGRRRVASRLARRRIRR